MEDRKDTLLQISSDFRYLLYSYLTLPTNGLLDLDTPPKKHKFTPGDYEPTYHTDEYCDCTDRELAFNLLLTCKTIYEEVSSLIYTTNDIRVRLQRDDQNSGLLCLRPSSISAIRDLRIFLNVGDHDLEAPTYATPSTQMYRPPPRPAHSVFTDCQHGDEITKDSLLQKTTIKAFQEAMAVLSQYLEPGVVKLQVVADCQQTADAETVCRAMSSLPQMKSARVLLAHSWSKELATLAQVTSRALTGQLVPSRSDTRIGFLDLPQEIRTSILSYTDLVTPLEEVSWSPDKKFHIFYQKTSCHEDECPSTMHRSCSARHCYRKMPESDGPVCFCRRNHSAYWDGCTCWSPPTALFLLSKQLLPEVRETFYQRNRFIIMPEGGRDKPAERTPPRLPISLFLRDVVPESALKHLRFLEIVFPPFERDYLRAAEPAFADWLATVTLIKDRLSLPQLSIRVVMANIGGPGHEHSCYREEAGLTQSAGILDMYIRTLEPLQRLRGELARFFAHAEHPRRYWLWKNIEEGAGYFSEKELPAVIDRRTAKLNRRLDALVMGEEYDPVAAGRETVGLSQWYLEDYPVPEDFWKGSEDEDSDGEGEDGEDEDGDGKAEPQDDGFDSDNFGSDYDYGTNGDDDYDYECSDDEDETMGEGAEGGGETGRPGKPVRVMPDLDRIRAFFALKV